MASDDEEPSLGQAPRLDPVLLALPPSAGTALVLEASAVRDSPVGQLLIECLSNEGDPFAEVREETGVDPIRDVDRVALAKQGASSLAVVEGDFRALSDGVAMHERALVRRQQVGEHGAMFERNVGGSTDAAAGVPRAVFATWGEGMFLVGTPDVVRAAIERLEGRIDTSRDAPLPAGEAYGEIYGKISASDAAELLPPEVAKPFREAAQSVLLHVDTREDLLLVGDVDGADPVRMAELARTVGGALSAARLGARAQGKDDVVDLLDLARVQPQQDSFRVEAALPLDWVRRQLADCLDDKTP